MRTLHIGVQRDLPDVGQAGVHHPLVQVHLGDELWQGFSCSCHHHVCNDPCLPQVGPHGQPRENVPGAKSNTVLNQSGSAEIASVSARGSSEGKARP